MTEGQASATIFSLSADLPAPPSIENPAEVALDAATLQDAHTQAIHPCHVRRLSAAGATLRVEAPLAPADRLSLRLANGQAIDGAISWAEGNEAGFVFDERIDVVGTLARNLAVQSAERRRLPRVELRQTVGVRRGTQFEFARTRDMSQGGVGVETRMALNPGEPVQLAFDGLRPVTGEVRWAQHGQAGIAFDTELAWQVLMPWLRAAQKAPVQGGYTPVPSAAVLGDGSGFGLASDKQAIRLDAPARLREGVRWWNAEIRYVTAHLVEFDSGAAFARGTQLWIALPGMAGWPACVIEAEAHRYLAEFRLPLRRHDLDQLVPPRAAQR